MLKRTLETIAKISSTELMRFKIGSKACVSVAMVGDSAIAVVPRGERYASVKFLARQLAAARENGAKTGLIYFGFNRRTSERSADCDRVRARAAD